MIINICVALCIGFAFAVSVKVAATGNFWGIVSAIVTGIAFFGWWG